jgi:hypothetical protein
VYKRQIAHDTTDASGNYNFVLDYDKKYKIEASKSSYFDGSTLVTAPSAKKRQEVKVITELEKELHPVLAITVKDIKTQQLLKTSLALQALSAGDTTTFAANDTGLIRIPLQGAYHYGETIDYPLVFRCTNYFDKATTLNQTILADGDIPLTISLSQPEVGMDVGKMISIMPIYFDYNKSDIRPDAAQELDKIVAIMQEYPGMIIELGSYTDCRGDASYNLSLSDRRAKSSAKYIISKGINKKRIYGKGYGESKPANQCECEGDRVTPCTEEEHQMNRRTEFIIVKMK